MKYEMKIGLTKFLGKARPRLMKSGRVYSPSYKDEMALGNVMRAKWEKKRPIPCDIRLELTYHGNFYRFEHVLKNNIITVKRRKRPDLDNIEKLIIDAFQKSGIIKNDNQICGVNHYFVQNNENTFLKLQILDGGYRCHDCGNPLVYEDWDHGYCEACFKEATQCSNPLLLLPRYVFK